MSEVAFASDNGTRFPFTLSYHSAWRLLQALEESVDDLETEADAEYRDSLRATLITELTHLAAWFRQHSGYDKEEDFLRIEAKLNPMRSPE
jgi:hypothetical protein